MKSIPQSFYTTLWTQATAIRCQATGLEKDAILSTDACRAILQNRTADGLAPLDTARLLRVMMDPSRNDLHEMIIAAATDLRARLFGNKVATMVPIELHSYCASNCLFCGWRKDNLAMPRLRISLAGLAKQVSHLLSFDFSHIELAGGDDPVFLRTHLGAYIRQVHAVAREAGKAPRVSICLSPLNERQYRELATQGLDSVLTWQETYDQVTYDAYISSDMTPKGNGLDDDFHVVKDGNGHLNRMMSQEAAVRAGLQVGLGCMIGLNPDLESDVLAVILHGRALAEAYRGAIKPLIIGMPIWNETTTKETDLAFMRSNTFDVAHSFDLIASIYLLAFADHTAWVFPNCRVPQNMQVKAVKAAGCFTSTMVRLGPGAYLTGSDDPSTMFDKTTLPPHALTREQILLGEQFTHFYEEHESYLDAFTAAGLQVVDERSLFSTAAGQIDESAMNERLPGAQRILDSEADLY